MKDFLRENISGEGILAAFALAVVLGFIVFLSVRDDIFQLKMADKGFCKTYLPGKEGSHWRPCDGN